MASSLVPGAVYRVRYATKTSSSTQKKGERRVEVLQGPHQSDRHKHGVVVHIKDLTDPNGPTEKTMYVQRFLSVKLDRASSNRHRRRNNRAADEEQAPDGDQLAVGDLVTLDRRETAEGITCGTVVSLAPYVAVIRSADSRRRHTVRRALLNKTSLASIDRKSKRMAGSSRRRRGVGTIV